MTPAMMAPTDKRTTNQSYATALTGLSRYISIFMSLSLAVNTSASLRVVSAAEGLWEHSKSKNYEWSDVVTGDKQYKKASEISEDIPEEVFMLFATYFQAYGGFY